MHGYRYCALTTEWFKGKNSNVTTSPVEAVMISGSNRWAPFPTEITCTRAVLDDPEAEPFGVVFVNISRAPTVVGNLRGRCTSDVSQTSNTRTCFIFEFLDVIS